MVYEVVTITPTMHHIPVPYGMTIPEAWERIKLANEEGREAWKEGTLLQGYVTILATPAGRIIGIQASC